MPTKIDGLVVLGASLFYKEKKVTEVKWYAKDICPSSVALITKIADWIADDMWNVPFIGPS